MANFRIISLGLIFSATLGHAQAGGTTPVVAKAEQAKIYAAAGAVRRSKGWTLCAEDPGSQGAAIELHRDLNGDGQPEAVVIDGSARCYGFTGAGYVLLSRNAAGRWSLIDGGTGMVDFLKTKGVGGWPDMQVGGPGFCFPVMRWDGKAYKLHHHEYQGKRCKPTR